MHDGESLDKLYAGAEVIREFSDCAERTWWLTGSMDHPAAYSVAWDDVACPIAELDNGDGRLSVMDLSYQAVSSLPDLTEPGGTTFGVVQDLHGDVVGLLDGSGNLVESYVYDVYGGRTVQYDDGTVCPNVAWGAVCTSELGNPRGYTGQFLSGVTGLYDFRNRLYDPRVRIFVSPDPLGFVDGYDLWQYVGGDPLNFVDPWGLESDQFGMPPIGSEEREGMVRFATDLFESAVSVAGMLDEMAPPTNIIDAGERLGTTAAMIWNDWTSVVPFVNSIPALQDAYQGHDYDAQRQATLAVTSDTLATITIASAASAALKARSLPSGKTVVAESGMTAEEVAAAEATSTPKGTWDVFAHGLEDTKGQIAQVVDGEVVGTMDLGGLWNRINKQGWNGQKIRLAICYAGFPCADSAASFFASKGAKVVASRAKVTLDLKKPFWFYPESNSWADRWLVSGAGHEVKPVLNIPSSRGLNTEECPKK